MKELLALICRNDAAFTGRQACTFIAKVMKLMDPTKPELDPRDIWKADPNGDLFHMFEMWKTCREWLKKNEISPEKAAELVSILK
jgi:hypothetical protein